MNINYHEIKSNNVDDIGVSGTGKLNKSEISTFDVCFDVKTPPQTPPPEENIIVTPSVPEKQATPPLSPEQIMTQKVIAPAAIAPKPQIEEEKEEEEDEEEEEAELEQPAPM